MATCVDGGCGMDLGSFVVLSELLNDISRNRTEKYGTKRRDSV